MNPFNLDGAQAVIATGMVCWAVVACMTMSAWATVESVKMVCGTVFNVARAVATIFVKNGAKPS